MMNAMTVDVEDYFQVSAFEPYISREQWDSLPHRVHVNTNKILDIFAQHNVQATFFVLGWVAQRFPELLKRIVNEGHELASHGFSHIRVTQQTRDEFQEDVVRTKQLLEDITGVRVRGYRAASYSITKDNLWALEVLDRAGHDYSSSIYPIKHDLYGIPGAPRFPYHPVAGIQLLELPITTLEMFGRRLPCGGGGFFRLYPYVFSRWALKQVNHKDKQPGMFYFHPWELDPDQPRPSGLGAKAKFRHYLNLHRMERRLTRLLDDFSWGRMDHIFMPAASNTPLEC